MIKNVPKSIFLGRYEALASLFFAFSMISMSSAGAETVIEDDYVYIGLEAEEFTIKDDRWVLTDSSTGEQVDDPDGNHSDGAGGGIYFELLPDIRVTHDDPFGPPTAFWGAAGTGPQMEWDIAVPEPGRYYVHIRAYSTGTEDNGIHVGINGTWPDSGKRMQFCTAGKGWSWSSKQRDSGGNGACGAQKTIYFDIATAGSHTIAVSAREDGFEIDRLVLIKDLSGNTKICSPLNTTDINCVNGSIESADNFINLKLAMETDEIAVAVNQLVTLSLSLENLDGYDTANNVAVSMPLNGQWEVATNDPDCALQLDNLVCELASLPPTAPDEKETFEFVLQPQVSGTLELIATATADEVDDQPVNDSASLSYTVEGEINTTDVTITVVTSESSGTVSEPFTTIVTAVNDGSNSATGVSIELTVPEGLDIYSIPENCTAGATVVCELDDIEPDSTASVEIRLVGDEPSSAIIPVSVTASNDESPDNNNYSLAFDIDSNVSTTGGTPSEEDEDTGAASHWLLLLMGLTLLIGRGRYQRERSTVRS